MFQDNKYTLKQKEFLNYPTRVEDAVFGMGCFWCAEAAFRDIKSNEKLLGIVSIIVGYVGFNEKNLENYKGREVVKISYDPAIISYEDILNIFWLNIDPFDNKGQFCDRGSQYIAVIYYLNNHQLIAAKKSKEAKERQLGSRILTYVEPILPFKEAEADDQEYKINNPVKYQYYRWNCGRDRKLQEIWGAINIIQEGYRIQQSIVTDNRVLEEA